MGRFVQLFYLIFKREYQFAYRHRSEFFAPWIFFLLTLTFYPLAISPDPILLKTIAPGAIWVSMLLAILLSLDKIFRQEYEDGTLMQWLFFPAPLSLLILFKFIAFSFILILPLFLFLPVIGLFLHLSLYEISILACTIALGCPLLICIGGIFSAMIVLFKKGGVLLSLLVLPFYIPVLVFASGALNNANSGLPVGAPLAMLASMLFIFLPLSPVLTAAVLRIGVG